MASEKLNDLLVRRSPAGRHGDGNGLWLNVTKTGGRTWVIRYMIDGLSREMGLGSYPAVGLADAREKTREVRKLLAAKIDPIEQKAAEIARQKAAEEARKTFRECAEDLIASKEAGWRNPKHRQQWRNTLTTYVYPTLGKMAVADITTADVLKVLQPIWLTRPETASRVRGRIEAVLDYAKALQLRSGENPAIWRGNLSATLPARASVQRAEHHPALPFDDVADFIQALRRLPGISARGLELCILTATRTSETLGAEWSEIDFDKKIWTIPGERMKAKAEHRVPLSDRAIEILEEMRETTRGTFIFPGMKDGKPMSNMVFLQLLKRMKRTDFVPHGFRSTFRDWCGECTPYPREVAEDALAHTRKDKVEAAYRRGDSLEKRRQLMKAWADFCEQRTSKVIELRLA